MSKLLQRAVVKRENAENSYMKIDINDSYVDDCCYNLQQTIEFCLKYIVELNGENYAENHDVRAQLNRLKALGVQLPFFDDIRRIASTLNSWEAESRYNDDFVGMSEDIEEAREIADKLIDYCNSLVRDAD